VDDTYNTISVVEEDNPESENEGSVASSRSVVSVNSEEEGSVQSKGSQRSNSRSSEASGSIKSERSDTSEKRNQENLLLLMQLKKQQRKRENSSNSRASNNNKEERKLSSKKSHHKIVPIVSNTKSVKFKQEEDVMEIDIFEENEKEELFTLVRQMVLLETEEVKTTQFLEYIQKYNCFDKQDYLLVRHFLDQIAHEKKSLIIVLTNYAPNIQPLITMMTIAERRLAYLDNTNLLTPDSTLHTSFLDKQQQLQVIIDEAGEHIYGRNRK
jgi:hypothetical protein